MGTILEARNITKIFPGVRALDNINFSLGEGEIHAICGENGAGKSTLNKVLCGVYPHTDYEGDLLIDGEVSKFKHIADAERKGIAIIHQELSLFNLLSVTENLFVGHEINNGGILDKNAMAKEAYKWIDWLNLEGVLPSMLVGDLGVGKQQLIEIARAIRLTGVRILILDEPTASLTEKETELLHGILMKLRDEGTSIIYVSHKLDDVMELCDKVTVFRDGESVGSADIKDITQDELVGMMVGREISEMYPVMGELPGDEVIFEMKNFNVRERMTHKQVVKDVSLSIRKGEIFGLYGLVGAGRTELISTAYGSDRYIGDGQVFWKGKPLKVKSPVDSLKAGIAYSTEDRKVYGIIPTMSVQKNTTIQFIKSFVNFLSIDKNLEVTRTEEMVDNLGIKTATIETKIVNLSGGNQQKVLLARNLISDIELLILDEPTRGIDVGAKQEIYTIMRELVKSGVTILMISSELPEILGMSDNVGVMHRGRLTCVLDNRAENLTQEMIMEKAAGI
ncbi:MAG: sugar ABC transporter ATP-binding protein [Spirochaetales bacterium]|uniref:Sugar ABC transporter ATP-binding protein n=1 Tax=Candidatus Thalassospirochaeta sargassi TaxID=3119039 RepID=A0AAJ1MNV2_9SPIO|nr:sugar ABC transporter ATP-binding protein [Spirochaetales bacterium]